MRQPKNSCFRSSSLPQNITHSKVIEEYSAGSSNYNVSQSNQRVSKISETKNRL